MNVCCRMHSFQAQTPRQLLYLVFEIAFIFNMFILCLLISKHFCCDPCHGQYLSFTNKVWIPCPLLQVKFVKRAMLLVGETVVSPGCITFFSI